MNSQTKLLLGGGLIGIIAASLVFFGNPMNMGMCIACFLRDTAGALGLHRAAPVQYIRPELIGLVLGSTILALMKREFKPMGGSAPLTRFVLGFFVIIGGLVFLGCPFRMTLRLAGGDLNAVVGLLGFIAGIGLGVAFLKKGYSLKRTYKMSNVEGSIIPVLAIALLGLVLSAPAFIFFSKSGPGSMHPALIISLLAGAVIGMLAQRLRFCMVGGIRDFILFREKSLLLGFIGMIIGAWICNMILMNMTGTAFFNLGFEKQPIAHTDGLWNFLGMTLVGFACTLLGGCPFRQMVLAGEGNTDSGITVLGLIAGGAFAHNFNLASSPAGATPEGKIAVVVGLVIVGLIAVFNSRSRA